jgi:C4-dicarboxylate-specific signal transduction histidine kinase
VAHLDAIGGIATDLARELKRPLAGIENYIQTCLVKARTGSAEPRELLDDMEHAAIQARRAGEIVDRIHEFIRARGPRRAAVGINKLVREAADLVESEVRDNGVKVRMELAEKLPSVMVESTQIEQVIVNLIRNGLEAMADGRTKDRRLTIETSRANSGSVGCRIRDAGPGLPEEAIERIFEPFYTTKANGLGVGLSISQSIVEAHGGHLWASVNPDQGTTFQFTLPIS